MIVEPAGAQIVTQYPENRLAHARIAQLMHSGLHQGSAYTPAPLPWKHIEQIDQADLTLIHHRANPYKASDACIASCNPHPLAPGRSVLQQVLAPAFSLLRFRE